MADLNVNVNDTNTTSESVTTNARQPTYDSHLDFAYSTIATAPSPASSGTSLTVTAGQGALFPSTPFNATVWPAGIQPTTTNAEIIRVVYVNTDTFTITRSQESTSARSILITDQIAATISQKTLNDVEAVAKTAIQNSASNVSTGVTSLISYGTNPQLTFNRANGTITASSPTLSGQTLGSLAFGGQYDSSVNHAITTAQIQAQSSENFTSATGKTFLSFQTTASGSISPVEALRVDGDGHLSLAGKGTNPNAWLYMGTGTGTLTDGSSGISNPLGMVIRLDSVSGSVGKDLVHVNYNIVSGTLAGQSTGLVVRTEINDATAASGDSLAGWHQTFIYDNSNRNTWATNSEISIDQANYGGSVGTATVNYPGVAVGHEIGFFNYSLAKNGGVGLHVVTAGTYGNYAGLFLEGNSQHDHGGTFDNAIFISSASGANSEAPATNAIYYGPRGTGASVSGTPLFLVDASGNVIMQTLTVNGATATLANATNIVVGTSTGTKIGTATSQKLAFYGSTAIVQPTGDIITALTNLGLVGSPTIASTDVTGLSIASGKTLTASNTLTLAGTDSTTMTFPSTSATIARTDAANTFTGTQTFGTIDAQVVIDTNNTVSVTSNAGTTSVSYELNTFTNSSSATMTITLATTSAVDGQKQIVRIYDFAGVAESITWVNTENSLATVPGTSNGSTTLPLTVGFIFNSQTTKWRCVGAV